MKLASVVLAGGAGERFGGQKLSTLLVGRPLLAYALDAAAAAAEDIVVVVGTTPDVAGLAHSWSRTAHRTVRVVAAANQGEGMGASLRSGLDAVAPDVDGAFIFLGDMPFVPISIFPPLVRALAEGASAAAPTYNGRRGHPVLLGRQLIARRSLVVGDRGAGDLLSGEPGLILIDAGDDGVLFDVDTPDDLVEGIRRHALAFCGNAQPGFR